MTSNDMILSPQMESYFVVVDLLCNDPDARRRFRNDPRSFLLSLGLDIETVQVILQHLGPFTKSFARGFDSRIVLCSSSGY